MSALLTILGAILRLSSAVVWHVLVKLWRFINENPWRAMAMICAVGLGGMIVILRDVRAERDQAQIHLAAETKARADDGAAYALASQQAQAWWDAAYKQLGIEFQQEADKADDEAKKMVAGYAARTDDYARRMRLGSVCPAAQGVPGQPADAAQAGAAQGADGPGPDAVVVSRADLNILTDNTRRLKAGHDWAVEGEP